MTRDRGDARSDPLQPLLFRLCGSRTYPRRDATVKPNVDRYIHDLHDWSNKVAELSPPGSALARLRERDYAARYRGRGEPIHVIGVEFSRQTRNVTGFEVAAG